MTRTLTETYPDAHCELNFENPFQLLVATVMSAQSTDKGVNLVTPTLFAKYPTPEDLAVADPEDVETIIKTTGFFRAKTKSIMGLSAALRDRFGGEMPGRLADLVTLPGVGHKTANGILVNAFGVPGLPWTCTSAGGAEVRLDRRGGPGQGRSGDRGAVPGAGLDGSVAETDLARTAVSCAASGLRDCPAFGEGTLLAGLRVRGQAHLGPRTAGPPAER
jgi:hypothetical protein